MNILLIVNNLLFALTNGICTSSLFSMAPSLLPHNLKGKAGSSLSFALITGIFMGSLYGNFITKNIINLEK